jgi:hypothetical protein
MATPAGFLLLLVSLPAAIWPYRVARFGEQLDAIGSKRSLIPRAELGSCMARADTSGDRDETREIRLLENPDGQWTARDLQVEVSAQGATHPEALENLNAVVAAVTGEGGHEPTDENLRDLGVDSETARSQSDDLPDVLQ